MGSEDFKQNHANYGWKQVPWEQRQPGNAVLIVDDSGTAKHTMMYDSDNAQGQPLFNHSNGGHDESAIRKKAKYPHHNPYLTYEFVGTPADSTQWINDYKKIYGFADGGEVEPDPLEVLERSKPKIAGIPIDDKPLSGTDPLGEAYVNLVAGNATRKLIEKGITGFSRRQLYNNYLDGLKLGHSRRNAYRYADTPDADVAQGMWKWFINPSLKASNFMRAIEKIVED